MEGLDPGLVQVRSCYKHSVCMTDTSNLVGKPAKLVNVAAEVHALGKRLRSNAVKSSYSNALLISITRSERKLKIATASPSCEANSHINSCTQSCFFAVALRTECSCISCWGKSLPFTFSTLHQAKQVIP